MYECLNIVAEEDGTAGCVLIRAAEPLSGIATMRKRRPGAHRDHDLANGPGKLTLALGVTRKHNGVDVTRGSLTVHEGVEEAFEIGVSPRIGITHGADLPLRFFVKRNPCVSR